MTNPGKPTVLIVDDDQVVSQQLVSLLRAAGYPSKSTFDPVQGFMVAQRERPGLILLDINLPAGGGLRMLERLIKTTTTQLIPVVVITASEDPALEGQVRSAGAAGFLRKPIASEQLLTAITAALKPLAS
ncbi:MAG TPA: response regulator [Gemmatimonadales bacterium]|jgi:FixJ family two-component response regulator|nr:response regulator [Gemmatimonadales bacterium]